MLDRLVAAGLAGVLACSSAEPANSRPGSLEVQWIGSDTGKLTAPAVAEWCDSLKMLELRAIHGDTGIALAFYPSASGTRADSVPRTGSAAKPRSAAKPGAAAKPGSAAPGDSVTRGRYPVIAPERADSSRPSAAVALRWFAETSIRGFRGDSGTVVLEATGPGTLAGRFSAYLRSATEGSRLTVTGSFKGLTVTPAAQGCVGGPGPEPDEPEVFEDPVEPAESAD